MSKEVGARVLQVRQDANLNQREFATRIGISSGGISQIESGKAMPGGDFLLKIHQEFGVDVTWLLTGLSMGGAAPAAPALARDEEILLDNYRNSPPDARAEDLTGSAASSSPNTTKSPDQTVRGFCLGWEK